MVNAFQRVDTASFIGLRKDMGTGGLCASNGNPPDSIRADYALAAMAETTWFKCLQESEKPGFIATFIERMGQILPDQHISEEKILEAVAHAVNFSQSRTRRTPLIVEDSPASITFTEISMFLRYKDHMRLVPAARKMREIANKSPFFIKDSLTFCAK